jgi:hypothetical protein
MGLASKLSIDSNTLSKVIDIVTLCFIFFYILFEPPSTTGLAAQLSVI